MKSKIVFAITMALSLTVALYCNAQPGIPPRGPGREILQQVSAFSGQISNWVYNDDYVYDGFYLQTGSEKLMVKFPPHMGSQLRAIIKSNSTITVNGVSNYSPFGEKKIRMVSINVGGRIIYDTPPLALPAPPVENFIEGGGKITSLQKNRNGETVGYILSNETILRIPPHIIWQLSNVVQVGSTITFSGMAHGLHEGEAKAQEYTVVHCQTITVNGTQYLTR